MDDQILFNMCEVKWKQFLVVAKRKKKLMFMVTGGEMKKSYGQKNIVLLLTAGLFLPSNHE